jgi:hypothetical protein
MLYIAKTIIPHIMFTACSFLAFFLNPESYERITLGLFLLFVQIATLQLFADRIPHMATWSAVAKITTASHYITMLTLIESCIVCSWYWTSRTVRPKATTAPSLHAKLKNMWKMPTNHSALQGDLPILMKRQQTQAKIRAQMRISFGENDDVRNDYLRKDDKEKKQLRQQIKERKVQLRIDEEQKRIVEMRCRFVASRIDLAASIIFPTVFIITLFVILADIAYLTARVQSTNISEETTLGYVDPTSAASASQYFVSLVICSVVSFFLLFLI